MGNTDALGEAIGAFQVFGILPVILDEAAHIGQNLLMAFDRTQQVALADRPAGGPADIDFPLAVPNGHRAQVLDVGLGAVARTAGGGQLHLVGGFHALVAAFDLLGQGNRVAQTIAAEVGAHAAFTGPKGFGIGMAAGNAERLPHLGQVFFGDAQQVDALTARDFDHAGVVLFRDLGNALQFGRGGDTAINTGHHAEGAVVLNIGVDAVVDKAGVAFVFVFVRPEGFEQRGQTDLAARVFFTARQFSKDRADALQLFFFDGGDEFRFRQWNAGDIIMLARVLDDLIRIRLQQLGNQGFAASAAGPGLGLGPDLHDGCAAVFNRGTNTILGHAITVANLGCVRQIGRGQQRRPIGRTKEQVGPAFRQRGVQAEHLHQRAGGVGFAQENRAVQSVVANNQFFIHPARGLPVDHDFILGLGFFGLAHRGKFDAHDFEFGRQLGACIPRRRIGLGDDIGQGPGLLPDRIDQPIDDAPVLDALAHGKHVRVARPQLVVTHNPALNRQAGVGRNFDNRPNAGADHDHIGLQRRPIGELQSGDVFFAENMGGDFSEQDMNVHPAQGRAQQIAGFRVKLGAHGLRRGFEHRDFDSVGQQAARGLKPQQAPADNCGVPTLFGIGGNLLAVINGPKEKRTPLAHPIHGRHKRAGARGDNDLIVGLFNRRFRRRTAVEPIGRGVCPHGPADNDMPLAVNQSRFDAGVESDVMLCIPGQGVEKGLFHALRAVQHVGQQDAVVVAVGLGAEHGHGKAVRVTRQNFFNNARAGHAVANHHKSLFLRTGHVSVLRL